MITSVATQRALGHASYGEAFLVAMPYPMFDHLIEGRFLACGPDDKWALTARSERNLRARRAADRAREAARAA